MSFLIGDPNQAGKKEDFVVKMNKADIQEVFNQLEEIQTKLDSIM